MGFTLSHPAAVVPFARWLPLSALVAGSMSPDIVLVGSLPLAHHYGHVWPGLLYFSLPVAALLYLGFHLLAKWPLLALCPPAIRRRLAGVAAAGPGGDFRPRPLLGALAVAVALVFGIATHFVWDTLTHRAGWKPAQLTQWFDSVPLSYHLFAVLQIGSSLLGLVLLWHWLRRWLAHAPAGDDAPGIWPERTRVAIIALFAILAPLIVCVRIASGWESHASPWEILSAAGIAFMRFAVCCLIAYCGIWWARARTDLRATWLRAGVAALIFLPEFTLATASPAIIGNFGFEDGAGEAPSEEYDDDSHVSGVVGDGWRDNSGWAAVDVDYRIDHLDPHGGRSDQVVHITRIARGKVQFVHPWRFHAGVRIRFSVWLRSDSGGSVAVVVQEARPPWRSYGYITVPLSKAWQEFQVEGVPTQDEIGFLMIAASRPMQFAVDDAQVEESPAVLVPAGPPAQR
jgi:hypothetical protein